MTNQKSSAMSNASPATSSRSQATKTRQQNNSKEVPAANSCTPKQKEMPRAPSPKRRRRGQGCNLTEADIPHLVDTFVKAQCRQITPKSNEEGYTDEEYASDSSEVPLTDELSGQEIIYIYRYRGMHGDLLYVTVVYVKIVQ